MFLIPLVFQTTLQRYVKKTKLHSDKHKIPRYGHITIIEKNLQRKRKYVCEIILKQLLIFAMDYQWLRLVEFLVIFLNRDRMKNNWKRDGLAGR